MGNMWKLDSILRETLRYHGITLGKTSRSQISLPSHTYLTR